MNSGMLALLNSERHTLESDIFKYGLPDSSPFESVKTTLRVDEELKLSSGEDCFVGRLAQEDVERVETTRITETGEISEEKTPQKVIHTTQFLFVPDEFALVKSSAGEFFFPLLNGETAHSAFPAEISINELVNDHEDAEYWKVGFTGRGDGAENGVLHGDTVFNDSAFGEVVANTEKNQLGIDFEYNGEMVKLFLTRSGYVNRYGSNESDEFAELILDVILQYARIK